MAITLEGITLPDDLLWRDEFSGFGVGQEITPTLTGALVIEETAQVDGRRITLESDGASWVERSTVESLATLAATPIADGDALELNYHGTVFDVVFDRESGSGFSASEVLRLSGSAQSATHPYTVTINLLAKG